MAIDRTALMKKTKPEIVEAMLREVGEVDQRRQNQIRNQVGTINRLMAGATYDDEMLRLNEELADTQARLEAALLEIRQLKGQSTPTAYNLGGRGR